MRLKSFFGATVEAALAQGSRELGPDALLVQSRKSPSESQHLGAYEVVLAVEGGSSGTQKERETPAEPPLVRELADLRRQMDGMRRSLSRSALAQPRWLAPTSGTADLFTALVEAEVDHSLATRIAERVAARLGTAATDPELVYNAAAAEISSCFSVDDSLGVQGHAGRVAILVGPPGAGKTTTLVKLAVAYGLTARRPVVLISADNCRIAAADQLRSYAAILGVGFELVETTRALAQALELYRAKDLILVDTPGFGAADMDEAEVLAKFVSSRAEIDTHLVLSASMKPADITRAVDRFEIFRPAKLLFTRLDETGSLGPVLSEAHRTQKPISFLANGQQIPEHLEAASTGRITSLVLPPPAKERSLAVA
jgi:flagellar biosynthesis protein FlhF